MKNIIENVFIVLNTAFNVFGVQVTLFSLICYCAVAVLLLLVVYRLFD